MLAFALWKAGRPEQVIEGALAVDEGKIDRHMLLS